MRIAPLLTALAPFLVLPALLAGLGHPAALPFASFAAGLFLLTVAALLAIGIARLPLLCLGGIAAAGAALMPILTIDLGWPPAAALAVTPLLGIALGGLVWLGVRGLASTLAAGVLLALLLGLASLPLVTAEPDLQIGGLTVDAFLLLPLAVLGLLLLTAARFAGSPAARLHEAASAARLPADGLGLDLSAFRATGVMLAAAIAAFGGGILALGPAPLIGIDPGEWVALSLALFAIGRLGGRRLGAALLAALPLALLPKLTISLAPHFLDLTLAAALVAIILQLVVRADGSLAWQPAGQAAAGGRPQTQLTAPQWAER
jgi:hypothetical protein